MLRPELTEDLCNKLLIGKHINLVSPHGRGRRQTIADLLSIKPKHITVLYTDLKRHTGNIQTWFQTNIHTLQSKPNQHWVILHNLDEVEVHGLATFIVQLQALQHVRLLVVTTEALQAVRNMTQIALPK